MPTHEQSGMHLIHVTPSISEEASGPSYSVKRLCEAVMAAGADVTLAALDWAPMQVPPSFLKTFPIGFGPRRLGRSPAMRHWLEKRVRSGATALLHNHGMWQMNAVYPGQIAAKFGLPYVVSPRGTFSKYAMSSGSQFKPLFWRLLQEPSLRAASCFHATAQSEYEDIRRMGFRQPVAVIPNGVDIPVLGEKSHHSRRTLLYLGRIHPEKGLDMLLPAWRAVQERFPDWQLRLVGGDEGGIHGGGGYLAQMREFAAKLGLERIEFAGPLYGDQKWKAYVDADLFVLPTYSENFGMSVAEALGAGTPAIVTKGAPWGGLEVHGAGQWIDIGLVPLVTSLETMLSHPTEYLAAMGQRGREWMFRDYSWAPIGQQMADVYQFMLGHIVAPPACIRFD